MQQDFEGGVNLNGGPLVLKPVAGGGSQSVCVPEGLSTDVKFQLPTSNGAAGQQLTSDGAGNTSWTGGPRSQKATWPAADGATKTFVHNLGTEDVIVQCYDVNTRQTVEIQAQRADANTVQMTANSAPPASGWRVLIFAP